MKNNCLIAFATMFLLFTSCSDSSGDIMDEGNAKFVPIELNSTEKGILSRQNAFSYSLFNKIFAQKQNQNFMTSPLSVSMAMSMLANGAHGDTRSEILNVLGFQDEEIDVVNRFNSRLLKEIELADKSTRLSLANSIWIDNSLKVYDSFLSDSRNAYGADIFNVELGSEQTRMQINRWASDNTFGMIPEFFEDRLSGVLCLMNALYFKGEWRVKFDKTLSKPAVFHNSDGTTSRPVMMNATAYKSRYYFDEAGASWIKLDYGNTAFSLVLILPDENVSLAEYVDALSKKDITEIDNYFLWELFEGDLTLPRFSVESDLNLENMLAELGMRKAFSSDDADFSLMAEKKFSLNQVRQKAKIIVDEDGTEASAVTAITGDVSYFPQHRNFKFDRPFVYMLKENSTNTILFMGCVNGF